MPAFDFHTHDLTAPPGTAIVNLPDALLLAPDTFRPVSGALYSAGIHPWITATADTATLDAMLDGLHRLIRRHSLVAVGECGIDLLRGAPIEVQEALFLRQARMARDAGLPVTIHCVRAFHHLLRLHAQQRPLRPWTIHGFRGKPALARQLLDAGFDLSFGPQHNDESYALTPPNRRHDETDADPLRNAPGAVDGGDAAED